MPGAAKAQVIKKISYQPQHGFQQGLRRLFRASPRLAVCKERSTGGRWFVKPPPQLLRGGSSRGSELNSWPRLSRRRGPTVAPYWLSLGRDSCCSPCLRVFLGNPVATSMNHLQFIAISGAVSFLRAGNICFQACFLSWLCNNLSYL